MSADTFWSTHLTVAEAARKLGFSRQNLHQRCLKGSFPCDRDSDGRIGVLMSKVEETLRMRDRDKVQK